MNRTELLLDPESLLLLRHLVGGTWQCMGGRYMRDGTSDVAVFAVTDKASITISGPVDERDFEGDDDTYVRLRVREGAPERQAATKSGNLYFQNSGERVLDVVIVRQTITQEREGTPKWTFVSDIGVISVLSRGVVAISSVSHHTELLQARRADSLSNLAREEPLSAWENELKTSYKRQLEFLPIADVFGT